MNAPLISSQDPLADQALMLEIEPRTFVQVDFAEPEFSVRQTTDCVEVFHRNLCLWGETANRLLEQFERSAAAGDWWSPEAQRLADQLKSAIEERDARAV